MPADLSTYRSVQVLRNKSAPQIFSHPFQPMASRQSTAVPVMASPDAPAYGSEPEWHTMSHCPDKASESLRCLVGHGLLRALANRYKADHV